MFQIEKQEEEYGFWVPSQGEKDEFEDIAEAIAEAKRRASVFAPTRVVQVYAEFGDG